jgi:hypothetical protein
MHVGALATTVSFAVSELETLIKNARTAPADSDRQKELDKALAILERLRKHAKEAFEEGAENSSAYRT